MPEIAEPKDLGIIIISKEKSLWKSILIKSEKMILESKAEIEVSETVAQLARIKLKNME